MNTYEKTNYLEEEISVGGTYQIPFGSEFKEAIVKSIVGINDGDKEDIFICYYYADNTKFAKKETNLLHSKYIFDDLATFNKIRQIKSNTQSNVK